MNMKKLIVLVFVPVSNVRKAYSPTIDDLDDEGYCLLDYFGRAWVGQKIGRCMCDFRLMCLMCSVAHNPNLGSERDKSKFTLQLWNIMNELYKTY